MSVSVGGVGRYQWEGGPARPETRVLRVVSFRVCECVKVFFQFRRAVCLLFSVVRSRSRHLIDCTHIVLFLFYFFIVKPFFWLTVCMSASLAVGSTMQARNPFCAARVSRPTKGSTPPWHVSGTLHQPV